MKYRCFENDLANSEKLTVAVATGHNAGFEAVVFAKKCFGALEKHYGAVMKRKSCSKEDQIKITDYIFVSSTKVAQEEVAENAEKKIGFLVVYELTVVYFFEFVFFENDAAAELLPKSMHFTPPCPFFWFRKTSSPRTSFGSQNLFLLSHLQPTLSQ